MNSWDHHLLRKFSSTSHFRLMNQVRSELRAHPLKRNEHTRVLSIETKPSATYNSRENKRYLYNQIDRKSETIANLETEDNISTRSFKDRLDSIEMR